MQFLFVRHGQPAWSRDGASVDDPDLTPLGREQAVLTGKRFREVDADLLLVSPLRRARQTAEPIAAALDLEPVVCDWLAEIRNPTWEGTPAEEVERLFAEARTRPVDEHWEGLPGGEAFRAFHRRVTHGLQAFLEAEGGGRVHDQPALWSLPHPDRRVVVVAHAGTNAAAIGYLLGLEPVPWEWERFVSFHASVSELHPVDISDAWAYSLLRFADVAHLPPHQQTR